MFTAAMPASGLSNGPGLPTVAVHVPTLRVGTHFFTPFVHTMPMRLGMLGMWHTHAAGMVRQVVEHPDEFQLVGFYDPDPQVAADRREQWAADFSPLRVFDSAEDLLGEPLDGVIVEGRVHENLRLARLALASGRPVLLEKPAGDRFDEFRLLCDLARRENLHVQMSYLFRYMSAVREMLARARDGRLGRIYEFRARLPKELENYQHFAEQLAPYAGGLFFEMAGHVIDMMVAMLGEPKQVTSFLAHHHSEPPQNYVDHGVATFGFEHAWGVIEVAAMEVAPNSRRIEVYGSQGACAIPHLGSGHLPGKDIQPIEVFQAGQADWQRLELPAATLQISDLREFAAVVSGAKQPDYSPRHDLAVQKTLLQASGMMS